MKIGTYYLVFFDILDENKKISILSCGHSDTEEIAVILCSLLKKKLWKKMVINYHHRIESGSDANDSHELLREFQKLKEKF